MGNFLNPKTLLVFPSLHPFIVMLAISRATCELDAMSTSRKQRWQYGNTPQNGTGLQTVWSAPQIGRRHSKHLCTARFSHSTQSCRMYSSTDPWANNLKMNTFKTAGNAVLNVPSSKADQIFSADLFGHDIRTSVLYMPGGSGSGASFVITPASFFPPIFRYNLMEW